MTDASREARQAARAEGLRYSSDSQPGFSRVTRGKGFFYRDSDGHRITDVAVVRRIRSLAIPPAYKDVWICPNANGHLQATARDARGRKQYRYHPQWREHRDATKFDRMLEFGRALPRIRHRVSRDLRARGLPREKVLATMVRLLESTLIRVGNEEYARTNGSFGLTTLRNRHVELKGGSLALEFRGKSGVAQRARVTDRAVARIVRDCRDIPGQELFQWIDESGARRPIDSSDVNDYLREASGGPFTAKDFRTWFATLEALELLRRQRPADSNEARKQVLAAVKAVAEKLGNTPAICRKCYIHPVILSSHEAGGLTLLNGASAPRALRKLLAPARKPRKSRKSPTYRGAERAPDPLRRLTAARSAFS
ncbi:MAG: DNA topoisomerase IB [Gammaproteobacteria bacterium]